MNESEIVAALAEWLADKGVGAWSPDARYGPEEIGIYYRAEPAEPVSSVVLACYPVMDHPSLSTSVLGLQVRTQAAGRDPRDTDNIAGTVFDALHGKRYPVPGIVHALRQSGVSLGQDPNTGQWARTDNYYLTITTQNRE